MIRHAKPEDAKVIHDVALKSWKDTYSQILSVETIEMVIDKWYSLDDLREQTSHPIFYVAEEEDEVVGFVHASVSEGKATLHRIYLDPKYQGQGIGSRLYITAENDIKDAEAVKIELEVLANNQKGNNFYQKQGFEEQETEQVEFDGEKVCQKILTKSLEN